MTSLSPVGATPPCMPSSTTKAPAAADAPADAKTDSATISAAGQQLLAADQDHDGDSR